MNRTVVHPEPYDKAMSNPMGGFRCRWFQVDGSRPINGYLTTLREYFPWNRVEPDASAGVDAILAATEEKCPDLPARNLRLIPRVYLEMPSHDRLTSERFWPSDMTEGEYGTEFLRRAERLVAKMGEAWDNDPRIAGIEMGLYGYWGEQHLWGNHRGLPFNIPEEVQRVLGDAFTAAFRNKKVMVRYGNTFLDYEFGLYWDSFALGIAAAKEMPWIRQRGDYWKRNPMSGETAYNYGDVRETLGDDPTDTVSDPVHRRRLIDYIRALHASHIGWVSRYDTTDPVACAGGAEVQKAFGYRYVVEQFAYTADIGDDGRFTCALTLQNEGAAPFYYDWPVMLSLLDPATRRPVHRFRLNGDIRTVQPGDDYDWDAHRYRTPPTPVTMTGEAILPDALRGGAFLAAVSVDDPACGRPALRLACQNYWKGGWHPLGVVRWGGEAVLPDTFDDIEEDKTITYA